MMKKYGNMTLALKSNYILDNYNTNSRGLLIIIVDRLTTA